MVQKSYLTPLSFSLTLPNPCLPQYSSTGHQQEGSNDHLIVESEHRSTVNIMDGGKRLHFYQEKFSLGIFTFNI